jgi:diguanylate cyclase (GGDEF)-like protein
MLYDPATIWYFAIFMMLVLAGIMFFSWVFMPEEKALGWWALALLLAILGISGAAARGFIPNFVSIELANGAVLLATMFAWTGFRAFEHRRPLWFAVFGWPLAWIVLCQLPLFANSLLARSALMSVLLVSAISLAIRELWRGGQERMIARVAAIALLVGHALLILIRPLVLHLTSDQVDRTGQLLRDPYLAWYAQEWLAFLVLMSFTVIALVRERREINLKHATMVDELTALLNRRGFMTRSVQICRPGTNVALLALDLDHFKAVNDNHGHAGGDRLLVLFAEVLRGGVRAGDVVARIGGEEFGVLMPNATPEAAVAAAERIRIAFRSVAANLRMDGIAGTVSIGVATGVMPAAAYPESIGPMMARADMALYRAKALGRNRVELFEASATVTPLPTAALPRHERRAL